MTWERMSRQVSSRVSARTPIRVLNLFQLDTADRDRLAAVSPRLQIEHGSPDMLKTLEDPTLEVLFGKSAPPQAAVPRLRWLQVGSAGVDYLADSAPWARGVVVTTARGIYAVPMAEYVMTALLSASNRVADRRSLQLRKEWPTSFIEHECYGLRGKTLVIVGYGGVGRETARLATAFGMRMIAIKADPNSRAGSSYREPGTGDPDGVLPDVLVGMDSLEWAFQQADHVALTIPLTSTTRGLINRRLLGVLHSGVWIVNVSRGGVVVEEDLIESLKNRRIAGAWLDVFRTEPLPPESPFWSLPNVVVTPHLSGGNRDSLRVLTDLCCENLRRYLANEPLVNVFEPTKGY